MAERVLVISDHESTRRAVAAGLTAGGLLAETGETAVAALGLLQQSVTPAAVVADWDMPGLSGDRLLRAIKARAPQLIVVVVSGVLTECEYASLLAHGASACLPTTDVSTALVPLLRKLMARSAGGAQPATAAATRPRPQPSAASEFVREATRHPVALPVRVKVDTWDQYAVLYTGNLSRGGLFIRTADPPPVGTGMQVRLGLPDGAVLELGAEVVHVRAPEHAAAEGGRPGVGVRFVGVTDEMRRELAVLAEKVRDSGVGTPPVGVPIAAGAPTLAAPRDEAEDDDVRLAGELRVELARLKEQDFFAGLGVPLDAPPAAVRAAFLGLAKKWHPSRFAVRSPEIRAAVADIFILLRKAHDTLVEPGKAAAYRARLPRRSPPPRTAATAAGATAPPPRVPVFAPRLRAETLFEDAEGPPAGAAPLESGPAPAPPVADLARAREARSRGQLERAVELASRVLASDPHCEEAALLLRELSAEQKKRKSGGFGRLFARE